MKSQHIIGLHAVTNCLQQQQVEVIELLFNERSNNKRVKDTVALAKQQNIKISATSEEKLNFYGSGHQGVVAIFSQHSLALGLEDLVTICDKKEGGLLFLVLDGVVDPHNLGSCIRSAAAFAVDAVVIPKDNAATVNATVRKVAAGAADFVPVVSVTNMARALEKLASMGVWLHGFAEEAKADLMTADFSGHTALVMGGEQKGLRNLTMKKCDYLLKIPTSNKFSTLNVAVATAVSLYEVSRQRSS